MPGRFVSITGKVNVLRASKRSTREPAIGSRGYVSLCSSFYWRFAVFRDGCWAKKPSFRSDAEIVALSSCRAEASAKADDCDFCLDFPSACSNQ